MIEQSGNDPKLDKVKVLIEEQKGYSGPLMIDVVQ